MNSKVPIILFISVRLFVLSPILFAQETSAIASYNQGERFRKSYEFAQAQEAFSQAVAASKDSALIGMASQRIILCENGLSLLNYIAKPRVLGRVVVPKEHFFLYYDLCPSGQWVYPPDSLLQDLRHKGFERMPMLYRSDATTLVLSARDSLLDNGWDLFTLSRVDSATWGPAIRLGTYINSTGNEWYPVLSRDEKTLYFCSDGHYGLGGMNLYSCTWDEQAHAWGAPENLGIPFSSPFDDMLYVPSDDLQVLYLASNRASAASDSLTLYKIEYEVSPVKVAPLSLLELRSVAALNPIAHSYTNVASRHIQDSSPNAVSDSALVATREATAHYSQLVAAVREQEAQVKAQDQKLARLRQTYNTLSREEDKLALSQTIQEEELHLMALQENVRQAQEAAQRVETQFLANGVMPPIQAPEKQPETIEEQEEKPFLPQKQSLGTLEGLTFQKSIPDAPPIDLSFRFEDEAQIVPWENEPMGLYYRIKLFTLSRKATLKQLKGICPVFEVHSGSNYVYYAGQFYTYSQATKALSALRSKGISGAIPVAYLEGKSISIQNARKMEAKKQETGASSMVAFQIYLGSDVISQSLIQAVSSLTTKDIVKVASGDEFHFYIGPFSSESEAASLASLLIEKGFSEIKVEPVK